MQNFDYMRLDGHTLRVFVAVCENRSFSQVANLFNVNQSTISHTVDKMRTALDDPLFIKSGRGITPTEKALLILPRVKAILSDIEGLLAPEHYDVARDTRPVVVAIPSPALLDSMRMLLQAVHAVSSTLRLEIKRLAPRNQVETLLANEEAEIAVAVKGFRYPPTLNSTAFYSEDLCIFYDASQREPITDLAEYANAPHGVISFGGNQKSEVEKTLTRMGLKRQIGLVAPTASMLGDLIKGTKMISTMPKSLAGSVYEGLSACPVPFDMPQIEYELVWHRRFQNSGRNMWLRQLILETAQPSLA